MDKVWENNYVNIEKDKLRQDSKLYVRSGALLANQSIQNYDLGTLLYAVQGTTSVIVGNIFVEYMIALYVPCPYVDTII